MRTLTVLSVAYPLAPVRADTAGGAEQVVLAIDRSLVEGGHRSLVVAVQGSEIAGTLFATPATAPPFDDRARVAAHTAYAAMIERVLRMLHVDVVHMHGLDFASYLPRAPVPVLVSLHLPLCWYEPQDLRPSRPFTWLVCVSRAQERGAPADTEFLPAVENGVDVDVFVPARRKMGFALFLGRICPEKGVHLAIDAARRAGLPLAIAGEVFPYPAHLDYFAREIAPRLGRDCRFFGRMGAREKRRLLALARCVLIPSLVAETSSLVARESLAAGTPVIGFASGALREAVRHGRTGFLVQNAEEMAECIARADRICPEECRAEACRRFPLDTMIAGYLQHYRAIAVAPPGVIG